MMNSSQKSRIYKLLCFIAVVLACVSFSPLVIPYDKHEPSLFSFPYTLWTGLLVAVLFVVLTYLASRIHPGKEEDES